MRRKVLAVIRSKRMEDIEDYFASMPEESRNSIKGVSIDMSRTFRAIVLKYLPKAVIMLDRFHISAQFHGRVKEPA